MSTNNIKLSIRQNYFFLRNYQHSSDCCYLFFRQRKQAIGTNYVPLKKKYYLYPKIITDIMRRLDAIKRYLLIIRKLNNHPYITLSELQENLEEELVKHDCIKTTLSSRTLKRDIRDIRDDLGIPIEYSRQKNGYYIDTKDYWSPDNIERILEPFDILNSLNADTGLNNIVFPERRHAQGTEHLLPLIEAAKNCRPVSFLYQKYTDKESRTHKLHPYALKECQHRWYLLGMKPEQDTLITFGLDRISHLEIQSGHFKKRLDISIGERYRNLYGILDSAEIQPEKVVLAFNARDGYFLKSLPLHHSQRIIADRPEEDEFIISVYLKITTDFVMEILSRSASLQVIEPPHLREKICHLLKQALQKNTQ